MRDEKFWVLPVPFHGKDLLWTDGILYGWGSLHAASGFFPGPSKNASTFGPSFGPLCTAAFLAERERAPERSLMLHAEDPIRRESRPSKGHLLHGKGQEVPRTSHPVTKCFTTGILSIRKVHSSAGRIRTTVFSRLVATLYTENCSAIQGTRSQPKIQCR